MKRILVLIIVLLCSNISNAQLGEIKGKVKDDKGDPVPFAIIVVVRDRLGLERTAKGTKADSNGEYSIKGLRKGEYNLMASSIGKFPTLEVEVLVKRNQITVQNFTLKNKSKLKKCVVIAGKVAVKPPRLIDVYKPKESIISDEEIRTASVRDVSSITSSTGVISTDDGGSKLEIGGGRADGIVYFVDGVLMTGSPSIPGTPIDKTHEMSSHVSDEKPEIKKISETTRIKAGILTAGEINDFQKWNYWKNIQSELFKNDRERWRINFTNRYSVQVMNKTRHPIVNAKVKLISHDDRILWEALTDNTGKAELWADPYNLEKENKNLFKVEVEFLSFKKSVVKIKDYNEGINLVFLNTECMTPYNVDIGFVVDATGSMADEISFLKVETKDVIKKIKSYNKNLQIRTGSVFYRDKGEHYLTRVSKLSNDVTQTTEFISKQEAYGGGDYEEAVNEALLAAIHELDWNENARARILFLMLDAPPHNNEAEITALQKVIQQAASRGIRIIPLTSSGTDKTTEFIMRSLALATNGTYTFLTDHSGVGYSHLAPSTDDYKVELANDLMARLVRQFTYMPECEETIIEENKENKSLSQSELSNTIKVYPNPSNGKFSIELPEGTEEMSITDLSGKTISIIEKPKTHLEYNLSNYPLGIYFIRYQFEGKSYSEKLVLH